MFEYYNYLGYNSPCFFKKEGKIELYKRFSEAVNAYDKALLIDPIAVFEVFSKNFVLADRTLVKGILKSPWLARPNDNYSDWIFDSINNYSTLNLSQQEVAQKLFEKICNEIEGYVAGKTNIGILLSGGMDSRMVAGALDYLIKTGAVKNLKVCALTWGNDDSRDVVYAREIAKRLGWQWKQYRVTANELRTNLIETARAGCEYSPIHLHAVPQIRDDNNNLEVILAGSYGDSVGRAEYFGWKAKNLPGVLNNISGFRHFFHKHIARESLQIARQDVKLYHDRFPSRHSTMQKEMDYQAHYMRRMLNPCLGLLENPNRRLRQVFTHPDVYRFMWEVSLNKRTDSVYSYLLNEFKTDLSNIPWARTGLKYGEKSGTPDAYHKNHHTYLEIVRDELLPEIKEMVLSSELDAVNIFDFNSIKTIFDLLEKQPVSNLIYLEKLFWLAALAKMQGFYKIETDISKLFKRPNQNMAVRFNYHKANARTKVGAFIKKHLQR